MSKNISQKARRVKRPRVVISATHKSSGKTVITLGLAAALAEKGLKVRPFKKGPDYIDPMWLSSAAGRQCRNLDYFMLGWKNIDSVFHKHSEDADVSLIEGNKGLYDAIEVEGEGSTSNLARKLRAPVILVIDASRITRGVAPLILGYKQFEPDVKIAGVILNKVKSGRQEQKLRAVINRYCDVEILGCIRKTTDMELVERHLGLVPIEEDDCLKPFINNIRMQISYSVNLDKVMEIASSAPELDSHRLPEIVLPKTTVRLGIVRDHAFTFYYPENLEALREAGAELVPVDAIRDEKLPKSLDGLYIGGGFPEVLMEKLEINNGLRNDIRVAVENGMPVHAECGGLIYLAKKVSWNGKSAEMVGALDCEIVIRKKPKGHGYMVLETTGKAPYGFGRKKIHAHEFHYGEVVKLENAEFAYNVQRGTGIDGKHDGIVYKNVLASFAHLHHLGCPDWAKGFVSYLEKVAYSKNSRCRMESTEGVVVRNKLF
ncbi:MAG: cobyrinate a,c-diamide synthase [Nitrospinota bacterium]